MKNVLVIGSTGQIGSELTMKLRGLYNGNIVAGYIPGAEPKGALLESGPSAIVDITNEQQIAETVSKYNIDTIYNLAALLSAVAEAKPQLAWKIGMGGLFNVLEVAREMHCAVFTPNDSESAYHVRRDEGFRRIAERLLFHPFRRRYPFGAFPGIDFLCDASGRWNDRLCRRHLLFGCER